MYQRNSNYRRAGFGSASRPRPRLGFAPSRRRNFGGRGGGRTQKIDISRFINKAVPVSSLPRFVPKHTFSGFPIDERLKANIRVKGYQTPTMIQDQAIEPVLRGADVVGIANTGTGKTAAFLIPLINKVLLNKNESVLIVVPTRELAVQIEGELSWMAKGLGIYGMSCVGGTSISRQIAGLRHHNNFVVGTPGRLKDLIERKNLHLDKFNTIVLDEADRMLDMGFIGDMRFMVGKMPKERQTLFFSATFSREVAGLIAEFLRNPISISVRTTDTPESVEQDIVRVKNKDRVDMLYELLGREGFDKVLVFGRTKHGVEKLAVELCRRGIKAESIHGNKNYSRRLKALDLFKRDHVQVLVATDVAARGLDIVGVSHVINYDIPATYDDYVHRIGRTGRADKRGKALTFVE